MNNKLFKLGALVLVLLLMTTVSTFAQTLLPTIYVDVSNGSDTYTGANQTNATAGTGPVATIDKGLTLLANNGTLVILGGQYLGKDGANGDIDINSTAYPSLTSLTIQMLTLNSNTKVEIAGTSNFIFNITNGTITFAANSGEYLSFATAINFQVLKGTVVIPTSSMVRLLTGSTITMAGTAAFSIAAPQKGTNLNVTYTGTGSFTAGPESNYGSYGSGSLYINKTSGTVTFPNAMTVTQIQAAGAPNAIFSGIITVKAAGDILNNGTGSLTFNGSVNLAIDGSAATAAKLTEVTNNAAGSIVFNGPVTWTVASGSTCDIGLGATLDFHGASVPAIANTSTGTITFANTVTLVPDQGVSVNTTSPDGPWSVQLYTYNSNSGGNISFNAISETSNTAPSTAADVLLDLTNAGTVTFTASTTLNGVIYNTGTIALGGNNLTLSTTTAHNSSGTISGTGSTVVFSSSVTFNGGAGGTLPSISIPSGKTLTFSGATTVTNVTAVGNLTLNAASTLSVKGDFNRTSGTFTANATSTLRFNGTVAQLFNCGPNFTVVNLTFANTAGATTVGASIRATGTVTINTGANVTLGTLNIILKSGTAKMINSGSYTASGGGGVICGGVNTITDSYTGSGIALQGNGTYSYITIDVGAGNTVAINNTTDNVTFNGVLTLRSGNVAVNAGSGNAVNFGPTGTAASIVSYPNAAGTSGHIATANAGTFNNDNGVTQFAADYDLTYTGALAGAATIAAGTSEFDVAHVRNLTISTTAFGLGLTSGSDITIKGNLSLTGSNTWFQMDTGSPYNIEVKGNLNVASGTVFHGGATNKIIKLSGNSKTHTVAGQIDALSILRVTGAGSTLGGLQAVSDMAYVSSLEFEPTADNAAFSSTGLVTIAGNIKVQVTSAKAGATFALTMDPTNATVLGNVTVGNGAYTPAATITVVGATTSSFTGNVTLTNGTLTLTRGGVDSTVTGNLTLTKGTFTLGSHIYLVGTVTHNDAALSIGSQYLTIKGSSYDMSSGTGSGVINAGTGGYLGFVTTAVSFTPYGTTTTIPNLWVGANFTIVGSPLTVSNALVHSSGTIDFNTQNLTMSGNLFSEVGGNTYAITGGSGTLILTGTALTWTSAADLEIPNLTINAPTGTVTFASTSSSTARKFVVTGAFVQTDGNVALGSQTLTIGKGTGVTFNRTLGSWSMGSSGSLVLKTTSTLTNLDFGTGFAVDNLDVQAGITPAVGSDSKTKPFTVNKKLLLTSGAVTVDAGKMTLGDGIVITRAAGSLSATPTFAGASSNSYTGAVTTAKELQAAVTNLTVSAAISLAANVQVNGTLTSSSMITCGSYTITMAANSTFELQDVGTALLDKALSPLGALNLVYNKSTAFATSVRELGSINSSSASVRPSYYSGNIGNLTIKGAGNLQLGAHLLVTGTLTFATAGTSSSPVQGGSLDIKPAATAYVLETQGNVVQTGTLPGFFMGTSAASSTGANKVKFTGANNTLLTLTANTTVPANASIYISKTNASNTITLSGANLDFTSSIPYFVNGLIVTLGTTAVPMPTVVLAQSVSSNQPSQGFDISGMTGTNQSGVNGNVKKLVDAFTGLGGGSNEPSTRNSRVIFPTAGSSANPYYRPLSVYFKTQPSSNLNLTVSHVDAKAGGQNGFPITSGTKSITNYPNFYWFLMSDVALAPSFKYDMDAQAQGYTDYSTDGIQNIRFVRRDSGNVNNQWLLQGSDANYDNSTVAANWPVVKVIDATGGITTNGSIFSYSMLDKPPVVTLTKVIAGATVTATKNNMNEGDTLQYTYAATEPDFGQTATLGVQSTNITGYSFNATTGVFKWKSGQFDSGTKYLTIRATSSVGGGTSYTDKIDTIVVANVPVAPTLAAIRDTSIGARQTLSLTLVGASTDTDRVGASPKIPLKYRFVVASPVPVVAATVDSLTGAFSWTPDVTDTSSTGFTFSVKVNDGITDVVRSFKVIVVKAKRVPYYATANIPPATVTADMGKAYNFAYVAVDSDGVALTYSIVKAPAAATIAAGVLNYYVPFAAPGTYKDTITVRASNGTLSTDATTILTRNYKNANPKFTAKLADGTLNVGDTLQFSYAAADSNGDALRYYGIQYPGGAKIDSLTGKFFWIAASQQTAIYVIKTRVTDNQGGADTISAQVLVQVLQVNVTGTVTYNGGTVPVNGVSVTITGGLTPQVVTTNTNGAYTTDPNKLNSGAYTFNFSKIGGHPTVYTNAADALKAALYSVDATTYPLSANAKLAADVNNDGNVNSADALQIMLRYVGSVTSFAKGDWIFVPTATSKTLTNADFVNNVVAIAVGDVNGDAQPGGAYFAKANGTPSVVAEAGAVERVNMSQVFEVPIRVKASASFGSMSLAFQYPVASAEFLGVKGPQGMVSAANNGMVAVAWFSTENALNVKENNAVVTLRFKPTANVKDFSLTLDPNSQVTDAQGTTLSGINLVVPAVDGSIPTAFGIGQNYPNPFNPSTTIQYDLPVAGHVTMVVYNMLGQVVDRLVDDQQNPGTYKIRWDASKMSSGVYLYHITVDAGKQTFKEVRRMVLLK